MRPDIPDNAGHQVTEIPVTQLDLAIRGGTIVTADGEYRGFKLHAESGCENKGFCVMRCWCGKPPLEVRQGAQRERGGATPAFGCPYKLRLVRADEGWIVAGHVRSTAGDQTGHHNHEMTKSAAEQHAFADFQGARRQRRAPRG